MFTLSGTVKVKNDTKEIGAKGFKVREFVVTDASGNYPQDISFQLTQDRVEQLDNLNVGDMANVSFFIRGREWTSPAGEVKYFNSLDVWKIEKAGNATPTPPDMQPTSAASAETFVEEGDDDLPF